MKNLKIYNLQFIYSASIIYIYRTIEPYFKSIQKKSMSNFDGQGTKVLLAYETPVKGTEFSIVIRPDIHSWSGPTFIRDLSDK
jgi:hypothetical protein